MGEVDPTSYPLHAQRVVVAGLQGRLEEALVRIDELDRVRLNRDGNWLESQSALAEVELWAGLPVAAAARLDETLAVILPTDNAVLAGMGTATAARAHAALASGAPRRQRAETVRRLRAQRAAARADPFGPQAAGTSARGWGLVWEAEVAGLEGTETAAGWVAVAAEWDRLDRPHDAAYCRWRAARARSARAAAPSRTGSSPAPRARRASTSHCPGRSRPPRRVAADRPDRHRVPSAASAALPGRDGAGGLRALRRVPVRPEHEARAVRHRTADPVPAEAAAPAPR